MILAVVTFLVAVAVSAALTPLVGRAARHFGLLNHALSSRKVHGTPVPRLGGLAIIAAVAAPLALARCSIPA